jgi:riboflavin kinase/FMN adenylyltransferase
VRLFAGAQALAAARAEDAASLALAIGNFDGLHLGHQALLREVVARADDAGLASAVLTFTPHPARMFAPDKAPPLIMPLERRLELIAEAGIEIAIVEPFTRDFAAIPADAFVRRVLAQDLDARELVVGYDFSFGRGRGGSAATLAALGAELGLGVAVIPPVAVDGVVCSSTQIRALCAAGDLRGTRALLGRPFEIEGAVVRGAARGRTIGFPTANLAPDGELLPKIGIYAARAQIRDGAAGGPSYQAALSIGRNPTFTDAGAPLTVEAYLLDFDGDLYDRRLRIEVLERLRDEQRFASVDALVQQIQADVARVRAIES